MSPYARSSRPVFEFLSKRARLTFSNLCRLILWQHVGGLFFKIYYIMYIWFYDAVSFCLLDTSVFDLTGITSMQNSLQWDHGRFPVFHGALATSNALVGS